ncbi:MAG: zinc ribbon domain-containing protein [Gemmatimonadaceae bacterium]|nr:zinc ribbon domain-containing protein [Gemmatimonadaceae bacterium]
MSSAFCAACGAQLTSGARFCHRCGQPVGEAVYAAAGSAPTPMPASIHSSNQTLPWAVAAIALLALIALVAGQRFGRTPAAVADAPISAPQSGPFAGGDPGGAAADSSGGERPVRAPDISAMSPDERALRLFNRVVSLAEQGKRDSVQFFAPMALMSFQSLPAPTALQRFELGRIAELAEVKEIITAQADTLLQASPTHLLGLSLASTAAGMKKEFSKQADFDRRLIAAATAERAKNLPEYQVTQVDLDSALARARRNVK